MHLQKYFMNVDWDFFYPHLFLGHLRVRLEINQGFNKL